MKKRTRVYISGCCAPLFLALLLGEGVCSTLQQHPAAALQGQGITLSEVFKLPRRVLGKGHNSKPFGHNQVTTYLVEEVTLPHPVVVEIRGKKKRVTRAYLVTLYAGYYDVRAIGPFIGIGDAWFMAIGNEKPDALTAVTFDRALLREGVTLKVEVTELPEKLTLKGAKEGGR